MQVPVPLSISDLGPDMRVVAVEVGLVGLLVEHLGSEVRGEGDREELVIPVVHGLLRAQGLGASQLLGVVLLFFLKIDHLLRSVEHPKLHLSGCAGPCSL